MTENTNLTDELETELHRGEPYPAPGGWELNVVEMDGVTWELNPRVDDEGYVRADARAHLTQEFPGGPGGDVIHSLSVDSEDVLTYRGEAGWTEDGLWPRVHRALADADPDHEFSLSDDADLGNTDSGGEDSEDDEPSPDTSLDEFATDGGEPDDEGLHGKYEVLKDGEPQDGCFVLKPETDAAAREALEAYADATDNPALEQDIREWNRELKQDTSDHPTTRGGSDFGGSGPAREWRQKARENVQKWGLQPVDSLLLAMGEEMGELAGEVHGMADYPDADGEGARMAEHGRDLIRRMDDLGRDIRDYLETVSEQDGEPVPVDERPNYLNPFPEDLDRSRRARHIRAELDDLMALGNQFSWALEGANGAYVIPGELPDELREVREDAGLSTDGDREPRTDGGADVHVSERCDGADGHDCVREDPTLTRGEDEINVTAFGPGSERSGERRVLCSVCREKQNAVAIADTPDLAGLYSTEELHELRERFPDILGDVNLETDSDGGDE